MKRKVVSLLIPTFELFLLLSFAACTLEDFTVAAEDNGMVKYAVSLGHQSTKAVAQTAFPISCGNIVDLSGGDGEIMLPMELETAEGINKAVTTVVTKGTQVNPTGDDGKTLAAFSDIVDTFEAIAYDGNGDQKVSQTVTWNESSSAWVGSPVTYWPQATSLNFLAYANLPSEQSAAIASTGVSTSHTVPATAADQTDILFGYYQGDGGNTGTAEIRFEHPLTAVRFKYGTIEDNLAVKSISIDGVAESGTAMMTPDGAITWSEVDSYDYAVSQKGDATTGLTIDATTNIIGEPFLIIPQKLTDHNVEVSVTFTNGTKVAATLTSGELKAGYTNTYIITYGGETVSLTGEIEDYRGVLL